MPYEDMGDAYMNHAGGGMYRTGGCEPTRAKLNTNRTNDDKVTHDVGRSEPFVTAEMTSEERAEVMDKYYNSNARVEVPKPTQDEIRRVSDWWFEQRDRMAKAFGVEPRDVPAGAVWFLDIDYVPTEADIAHAKRLAQELGLEA